MLQLLRDWLLRDWLRVAAGGWQAPPRAPPTVRMSSTSFGNSAVSAHMLALVLAAATTAAELRAAFIQGRSGGSTATTIPAVARAAATMLAATLTGGYVAAMVSRWADAESYLSSTAPLRPAATGIADTELSEALAAAAATTTAIAFTVLLGKVLSALAQGCMVYPAAAGRAAPALLAMGVVLCTPVVGVGLALYSLRGSSDLRFVGFGPAVAAAMLAVAGGSVSGMGGGPGALAWILAARAGIGSMVVTILLVAVADLRVAADRISRSQRRAQRRKSSVAASDLGPSSDGDGRDNNSAQRLRLSGEGRGRSREHTNAGNDAGRKRSESGAETDRRSSAIDASTPSATTQKACVTPDAGGTVSLQGSDDESSDDSDEVAVLSRRTEASLLALAAAKEAHDAALSAEVDEFVACADRIDEGVGEALEALRALEAALDVLHARATTPASPATTTPGFARGGGQRSFV